MKRKDRREGRAGGPWKPPLVGWQELLLEQEQARSPEHLEGRWGWARCLSSHAVLTDCGLWRPGLPATHELCESGQVTRFLRASISPTVNRDNKSYRLKKNCLTRS